MIRTVYFGCRGEAYPGTTRHLDLKTKAPKQPDPEFVDESAPSFRHVRDLPFPQPYRGSGYNLNSADNCSDCFKMLPSGAACKSGT